MGPVTLGRLGDLGVASVGDLARVSTEQLVDHLGAAHGAHLSSLARGIDDRSVQPGGVAKSISHEETFEFDVSDPAVIRSEAVRLADAVASRLRANGLAGRTVTVKVRRPDFAIHTRSATLDTPVQTPRTLAQAAQRLFDKLDITGGIRLFGLAVTNLTPVSQPLDDQNPLEGPSWSIDARNHGYRTAGVGIRTNRLNTRGTKRQCADW